MLPAKFQDSRTFALGGEDLIKVLPYIRVAGILIMWSRPFK